MSSFGLNVSALSMNLFAKHPLTPKGGLRPIIYKEMTTEKYITSPFQQHLCIKTLKVLESNLLASEQIGTNR